jgi:hypothetical protein
MIYSGGWAERRTAGQPTQSTRGGGAALRSSLANSEAKVSDLAKSLAHIEQVRARKMMPANDVSMLSSDTGACAQQYLRERSSPPTSPVKRSDLDAPGCLG